MDLPEIIPFDPKAMERIMVVVEQFRQAYRDLGPSCGIPKEMFDNDYKESRAWICEHRRGARGNLS